MTAPRIVALVALVVSAALGRPQPTAGQLCMEPLQDRVSTELTGGGGDAFRDLGGRALYGGDRGVAALGYRHRSFDAADGTLHTVRLEVGARRSAGRFALCPVTGVTYQTVESLTVWLFPLGVQMSTPFAVGDDATLTPFLEPSLVYSRSSFGHSLRTSVDPAFTLGAMVDYSRYYLGTSWERRFLDDVDGSWRVFLGAHFER